MKRIIYISFRLLFTISVTVQVGFAQVERIVTTLAVIDSDEGIPLDYNYNETIKEEELTSAPGCPKSIDGFPWVYYGDPPKCHLSGFRGPCSEHQLLFLKDFESNEGVCVCEICEKYLISGAPIQVSPDKRYKFCGPDHVYDKTSRQCYDLNAQGSCEQAQWLVKDSSGVNVKCVPECPKSEESDKVMKYDHNKGECVLMRPSSFERRAQAYGVNPNQCREKQRYSFFLKRCYTISQRKYLGIF